MVKQAEVCRVRNQSVWVVLNYGMHHDAYQTRTQARCAAAKLRKAGGRPRVYRGKRTTYIYPDSKG